MRCLILGGDGMLGHQLLRSLSEHHDVGATFRGRPVDRAATSRAWSGDVFENVDVRDLQRVEQAIEQFRPDAVVNAVGIIKQRSAAKEVISSLEVNALFPHRLRAMCEDRGARLVHISTDCVFNGRAGGYTEDSPSDAEDVYGRTKFLGEVHEAPAVTLRSSIIGLEQKNHGSLIEWFLAQRGEIKGFKRALYTGVTTIEMSRVIENILRNHRDLYGVWQVASAPINKYDLLVKLKSCLGKDDVTIIPDVSFVCDRTLNGDRFGERTGYRAPSWAAMLEELAIQIREQGRYRDAA